jgi:hypothetical protein
MSDLRQRFPGEMRSLESMYLALTEKPPAGAPSASEQVPG